MSILYIGNIAFIGFRVKLRSNQVATIKSMERCMGAHFWHLKRGKCLIYESMGYTVNIIVVYKVYWYQGCSHSDIMAGMDTVVLNGVDILSLSFGGSLP